MAPRPVGEAIAMLGLGTLLLARAAHAHAVSRRVANWPTTTGRIVTSRVDEFDRRGSIPSPPAFLYEYFVDGKRYTSRTIWPDERTLKDPMPGDIDHIWSDYYEGKEVAVHFNRAHPYRSYLELRRNRTLVAFTGLGAFLLAAGLWFLFLPEIWPQFPYFPRAGKW